MSGATLNTKRNGMGIRPYTSVDENKFLRGAATTLQFGKIEATALSPTKKEMLIFLSPTPPVEIILKLLSSVV